MAITPWKALLFASGGTVAVIGTAYVSGALDPFFKKLPPGQVEAVAPPTAAKAETPPAAEAPAAAAKTEAPPAKAAEQAPAAETPAPASEAAQSGDTQSGTTKSPADSGQQPKSAAQAAVDQPAQPAATPPAGTSADKAAAPPAASQPIVPGFDVVRVESGGSIVIAGHAAPNAKVEVLNGDTVIGSATAGDGGDFAIVLDDPLKPGDYQLTLRATGPGDSVVASAQTAVVSVPDKVGGQVLAMVEEPGKPADIMTVPKPDKQAPPASGDAAAVAPTTDAAKQPADGTSAAAAAPKAELSPAEAAPEPAQPPAEAKAAPAAEPSATPAATAKVTVEAVEIDGGKIFVAGIADPGRRVRAYANEFLLGDAVASPDGHFLVESTQQLSVGEYTVRVDALDGDGQKVVARATVPFEREPGASIAAVAPDQPKAAAGGEQPAEVAAAQPAGDAAAKPAQPEPSAPVTPAPDAKAPETAAAPSTGETPATGVQQPAAVAASPPPDDGVPSTTAPKLQATTGAVIIRRRDTLWHISRQVYGHGIRYSTIYLANQDQISDPDKIWPGQVFKVPDKSTEGEAADLKALGSQATTVPAKSP